MSGLLEAAPLAGSVLLYVVAALLVMATLAAIAPRSRATPAGLSMALSALACTGLLGLGLLVLLTAEPVSARAGNVLGFPIVAVRFDTLSALLLVALGVTGTASSVYGMGYTRHRGPGRDWTAAGYPVFLASLALVFGSNDAFAFLLAWELMALSSAALVMGPRPSAAIANAGYIYLAMTHAASAALVGAFAILAAAAGSTSFESFEVAAATMPPLARDGVFLLILVAFGTKAGAIPFHVWLPRAHPVAPSHVSALMSGVMIKAGTYGILRLGVEIMGAGPEWWGLLVLTLGIASAVLGVLYALMEHDLKRLLAFSSVENIGVILVGVGIALLATSAHADGLATLALTAALFHTLNHALFKSALFLAAGSVQAAAGTRDLNALGGLARSMPITTVAFTIGAAAISGLPPLNGFASEWLTFQALLGAGADPTISPVARSAALLAIGGLGLTAALAVACFVKATGIGFLALPRSPGAAEARETSRWMAGPLLVLASGCVAVGLAAGPLAATITGVVTHLLGATSSFPDGLSPVTPVGPGVGGAQYSAAAIGGLLIVTASMVWFGALRARPTRRVPTWATGVRHEPAFEYTASSYAKLTGLYFGRILRPVREVSVELHPGTPFPRTVRYRGRARHLIDERLYIPVHRAAVQFAQLVRRLQNGSLQLYLAYTVTAVIILLVFAR